jgi:hypothetical protein
MKSNALRFVWLTIGLVALLLRYEASAQTVSCGTPHESIESITARENLILKLKKEFATFYQTASLTVQYIPIKAHILRQSNGTGGVSLADLNTALAQVNRYYISVGGGIQFYFCGSPNYIDNSAYYDFDNTEETALCGANDVNTAINLYFPNSVVFGSLAVSGYAYFPSTLSSTNRVFVQVSNATDSRTIAHELGHYFNLLHTFQSSTDATQTNREYVTRDNSQGANCATKGDLLCDTPADPYGRDSVSLLGCTYTGTARDPQGQLYSPSLSNIMSYYPIACGNTFTAGQYNRMNDGLLLRTSGANQYSLTCASTVTGANVPNNLAGTLGQSGLTLTFTDNSSNETGFLIERSTTSATDGFIPIGGVAPNVTTYLDQTTTAFSTYYYRVKASNSANDYSPVITVVTGLNYCIPSYTTSCNTIATVIDDFILKQGTTTIINNLNSNCSASNYGNYTGTSYSVISGNTYTFTARAVSGGSGTYFDQHLTVWLDYDQDGVFELSERVYRSDSLSMARMNPTATGSFTIPSNVSGSVRMRVRSSFNSGSGSAVTNPCSNLTYGETEDYQLTVSASVPSSITTAAVTPSPVCAGQNITVAFTTTNLSSNSYVVQLSDDTGSNFTSITTTGTSSPLIATIPAGTTTGSGYKVRVNSTSPAVTGSSSSAFIINAIPSAPTATTSISYCQNQPATALSATGSNLLWYTVATNGIGSSTAPIPSTSTAGTVSYWVSQTVGGCESTRTKIDVIITATPNSPSVTTPTSYCQNQLATALSATGSNLLWYTVETNGTGNSTAPTPLTTTAGTVSYWVSQTVGGCESNRVKIDVVVSAIPNSPTATTPVSYCQSEPAVALTATGSNLLWYSVATNGTGSSTAPIPSTTTAGTVSYWVSQITSGCESNRTKIDVNITTTPNSPTTTTPINYCQNQSAIALTATGSSLLWYSVATNGTGSSTAPNPTTTSAGTVSYWVSQTVGGCESTRSRIDVIITATPNFPSVTTPISYCQNQASTSLSATGSSLLWYSVATNGTGSSSAPIPSTATTGTVSYWVSQTVGGCESTRSQIDVIVSSKPSIPVISTPVNYCQNQTATALTATGSNLLWYTVPTNGTGSSVAPVPSTSVAGTTSYYVSQTVSGCPTESDRAQIDVIIASKPPVPVVSTPINYCQTQTATALTAMGSNLKWYTVPTNGTGSSVAPIPSTSTAGTTSYYVSQTVNGCPTESDRAQIDVIINAKPSPPTVSTPVNYCQSQAAIALTATGISLKWYTVAINGTSSSTALVPTTTNVGTTSYFVSQTVNNCESNRAQIDVVVTAKPTLPGVISPVNYSQNQAAVVLTATGSNLKWYTTPTTSTGTTTAPVPSTTTLGTTNYYVSQTINNCESDRAVIQVVVGSSSSVSACPTVKVYLEGNWNGTEMTTILNQQGLLPGQTPISPFGVATPAGQPYKTAPWNYLGTETVSSYDSDVVDWVLVSLRTNISDVSSTVYKSAALLRKTGTVTLQSACPLLNPSQSFYVVVEHRTHMGAASHVPIGIVNNKITYDFTLQQSYIPSNIPSSGEVKVGLVYCLLAGDCSKASFAEINANDSSVWRSDNGKFARYLLTDYNLDGEVNANDDTIWRRNNGKFSGLNF